MQYDDTPAQAADYLRQAIPLMVRHRIPPNPLNYALWYSYVSQRLPELNAALDGTLKIYGTCPQLLGEQLFRRHLDAPEGGINPEAQTQLIDLVTVLQTQSAQAAEETGDYAQVLDECLDALNDISDADHTALPLESIIRTLALKTASINDNTRRFQQQIDAAQSEIESLKQELQQTRQDARIDALTGLYNRRVFDAELEQLICAGAPTGLCLLMIDIDHFKHFNDSYGHLMGDKVLQHIGQLLQECCAEPRIPVRLGGEEFAVILPGTRRQEAEDMAESLRKRVEAIRIRQRSSGVVISSISASFGVACWQSEETPQQLTERTDQALYRAKEGGRNRVCAG